MTRSQTIIGIVVIAGFIILTIVLIAFKTNLIALPEWIQQILIMTFGALIAMVQQIVGYAFGSSKGSDDKTAIIKEQLKPKN